MLTEEQIKERVNFLGASDSAATIGMSRWSTPLEIWSIKTGQLDPEDISDKLAVKLGNRLEEVVAELFTEATGKKVHRVNEAYTHKEYPFLKCHIDRKVDGERTILQCKTASAWKAREWEGEEIPHEYIIQEMHELAVTEYDVAYIAVLIGNQDFKWKRIERDEKAISQLVAKEVSFWQNFVVPKLMPATIQKGDTDVLFKLFPEAVQGEKIMLDGKATAILESLESLKQDRKHLDGAIEQQENEIRAILGTAEAGEGGLYAVSWKNQVTTRLDTAAFKAAEPITYDKYLKSSPSRVLRIKKKVT